MTQQSQSKEEQAQVKLAQLIGQGLANLTKPVFLDALRFVAKERRAKYIAHIEAGFTEDQALELCRF